MNIAEDEHFNLNAEEQIYGVANNIGMMQHYDVFMEHGLVMPSYRHQL